MTASRATRSRAGFRLAVVGVTTACLFAALFARLWFLQVVNYRSYDAAADRNSFRVVCEPAPRGRILDRNGEVLVDNRISNAITLARNDKSVELLQRLSALFNVPVAELDKRMGDQRYSPLRPIPLVEDVPMEKIIYIRENAEAFKGVQAAAVHEREYKKGKLAAHVLGYTGPISEAKVKELNGPVPLEANPSPEAMCDQYRPTDDIGLYGVESSFEAELRGKAGVSVVEVDNKSRVLRETQIRPAVRGLDLVLGLDYKLQEVTERNLYEGLLVARTHSRPDSGGNYRAGAGSVVVQDPNNGEILAMASWPTFDPNDFTHGIGVNEYRKYSEDPNKPLINRAVSGLYAPGSTFKLITASAALRHGVITPQRSIRDSKGYWDIPAVCDGKTGCRYKNSDGKPAGDVRLQRSITISNDVYYYQVGWEFFERKNIGGTKMIQDEARMYGLGKRTGVRLPESDISRVSDPETLAKLHKANPAAFPNGTWRPGDSVNLAIGQGDIAVSPLQVNGAYVAMANWGTVYKPQVAIRTQAPDGTPNPIAPVVNNTVPLDPSWQGPMKEGFRGVVTDPRGTAFQVFRGKNLSVAGKTGTAQVFEKQDTALFSGWGPVDQPKWAVTVILEEAGFGGSHAAPVAEAVFSYLQLGQSSVVKQGDQGVQD